MFSPVFCFRSKRQHGCPVAHRALCTADSACQHCPTRPSLFRKLSICVQQVLRHLEFITPASTCCPGHFALTKQPSTVMFCRQSLPRGSIPSRWSCCDFCFQVASKPSDLFFVLCSNKHGVVTLDLFIFYRHLEDPLHVPRMAPALHNHSMAFIVTTVTLVKLCSSPLHNHASYATPDASLRIVTVHLPQVVIMMLSILFHCCC